MEAEFDPTEKSVSDARHWARTVLEAWGLDDARDVAELLVTELAANAVVHAASSFRVRLSFDGSRLRCEVYDHSGERPRAMRFSPEATAGRGYAIVRRMSERTGVDLHDGSKTVWFELPVPQRS